MSSYGRQTLSTDTGIPIQVTADGFPDWAPIGITIDWATVDAVSGSPATYLDGTVVAVGQKGIPLGTVLVRIDATNKFGPYASGASDGRQNLERGNAYILNMTVVEPPAAAGIPAVTDHPGVIEGGLVWKARLLIGGAGQPTVSAFEAAFPRIRYAGQG